MSMVECEILDIGAAVDKIITERIERMFTVNLNDTVKVRLTDLGKDIYYHQYDNLNRQAGRAICKPKFPEEDEEGYTQFQLWDFINLYGNHIGMTKPNVIEPLNIVFEDEESISALMESASQVYKGRKMTNEYIPREAAMPDRFCVGVSCQECPFCDDPIKGGCKVARFIDAIPAADAVAVVRCRECKHCVEHYDTDGNAPYWTCKEWDSGTDYDGYCHYGERKDGGQDE